MAVLRHEINLIGANLTTTGDPANGMVTLTPDNYSGSLAWYFEIIGLVATGTATVRIHDSSCNVMATISLTETTATLKREAFSTAPTSAGKYHLSISGTFTGLSLQISRIIILQTISGALTATEQQYELAQYTSCSSGTFINIGRPRYFTYNSANFDGTLTAYFESMFRSSDASSLVEVRLVVDDGNWANWTEVVTLTSSEGSTTFDMYRSTAISLTNGRHYKVMFRRVGSAGSNFVVNAKIVIVQTSETAITKFEEQYFIRGISATGLQGKNITWNSSEWTGSSVTFKFTHDAPTGTDSSKLVDITADPDADISDTTVTGANEQTSSVFIMPTTGHVLDANVISGTTVAGARIIVYVILNNINIKVNIGGVWKTVSAIMVNIGGVWKTVSQVKTNIGGTWKTS